MFLLWYFFNPLISTSPPLLNMLNGLSARTPIVIKQLNVAICHYAMFKNYNRVYKTKNLLAYLYGCVNSQNKLVLNENMTHQIVECADLTIKTLSYINCKVLNEIRRSFYEMINFDEFLEVTEKFFPDDFCKFVYRIYSESEYLRSLVESQYNIIKCLEMKHKTVFTYNYKFGMPIDNKIKEIIISSLSNSINIFLLFDELVHFYLNNYLLFSYEMEISLCTDDIKTLIEEAKYLKIYYQKIKQVHAEKYYSTKKMVSLIKAKDLSSIDTEKHFLFLVFYSCLINFNDLFIAENHKNLIFLCLLNEDEEYQTMINKIESFLNNNLKLYEIIIKSKVRVILEQCNEFIIKYSMLLDEQITKYKTMVMEITDEIYNIIYLNAIFNNEEQKNTFHLKVYESKLDLFFNVYMNLYGIMNIYDEFFYINNIKTKLKSENKNVYKWIHPCRPENFIFFSEFLNTLDNISEKMLYLGISDCFAFLNFSFFSNFDLWLENVFNNSMVHIIEQVKNIDANKFIRDMDKEMFMNNELTINKN